MYELEYLLLVIARVASFVFVAPFFSMPNTPRRFKVAVSIFIASLLYFTMFPHYRLEYSSVIEYSILVIRESATGLIIGLGASICTGITLFAGRLVDMNIGLAMANEYDPTTKQQTSVSGVLYNYLVMLVLMTTNFHHYLLRALKQSYDLIPVNGMVFNTDKLVSAIVKFMGDYINLGFQLSLPIFAVMLITNCILGIMAKVAPQMNMFAVGMQIKLLIGLGAMFLTINLLPYMADLVYDEMRIMVVTFVKAIMP